MNCFKHTGILDKTGVKLWNVECKNIMAVLACLCRREDPHERVYGECVPQYNIATLFMFKAISILKIYVDLDLGRYKMSVK